MEILSNRHHSRDALWRARPRAPSHLAGSGSAPTASTACRSQWVVFSSVGSAFGGVIFAPAAPAAITHWVRSRVAARPGVGHRLADDPRQRWRPPDRAPVIQTVGMREPGRLARLPRRREAGGADAGVEVNGRSFAAAPIRSLSKNAVLRWEQRRGRAQPGFVAGLRPAGSRP